MIPPVPVSVPLNATLPTLVAPRPVEQERDRNNPLTATAITSTDENGEVQGEDERASALRNAARRETPSQGGGEDRGDSIDILV